MGQKNVFEEIISKIFLNLMKDRNLQIQDCKYMPHRINTKKDTLVHIRVKLLKAKDKKQILKAARKK